mgnify:FL=1
MKNEKNEREIEMQGEKNAAAELNRGRRVAAELAKCAIFVVLMIVSAFIKIPFPLVPLTFQTVVAVLAGLLLGPLYGTAAVGVYIFMGLIGLPVFTSGGGFAYVVQPTFGYILGFAAAAFVAGALCGRGKAAQITLRGALLASVAGFLVNYIVGVPYFLLIWHFYMHNGGVWQAAVTYNLIYMPKDLALCLLAGFLAWRVRPLLDRLR